MASPESVGRPSLFLLGICNAKKSHCLYCDTLSEAIKTDQQNFSLPNKTGQASPQGLKEESRAKNQKKERNDAFALE